MRYNNQPIEPRAPRTRHEYLPALKRLWRSMSRWILRTIVPLGALLLLGATAGPLAAQRPDSLIRQGRIEAAWRQSDSTLKSTTATPLERIDALLMGGYIASLQYRTNNPYSLPYYTEGLELAKQQHNYPREALARTLLGTYYARCLHQPSLALQYHQQALNIGRTHNDSIIQSGAHNNLGAIYAENYQDSLALLHFKEAIALMHEGAGGQFSAENNIGAILMRQGAYEEAISYFLLAQSHIGRVGGTDNEPLCLKNIGECYTLLEDYQTAESWTLRSLKRAEQLNDTAYQVYAYLQLAEVARRKNLLAQATQQAQTALALSQSAHSPTLQAACYASLSQINANQGRHREALDQLRQYNTITDSLQRVEKRMQIEQLEDANQQIMTHQQLPISMQQLQKRTRNYTLLVVLLATATIAAVALLLVMNRKRQHRISNLETENELATHEKHLIAEKSLQQHQQFQQTQQQLSSEIEKKHREIANYALLVENKNQLLLLAIHEIEKRRNDFKVKNRIAMDALLARLRASVHIEEEWNSFRLHFENVHPEFFSRLLQLAPNLTPDDLRFCACLCLNLSSKDISRLLHITPEAVRQRIYRIRKKLDFSTNAELIALLTSL